jgi:GNAT superfamily N-acetyltransferase
MARSDPATARSADMQATRTYLELTQADQFRPAFGAFPDVQVERIAHPTPELYRHCYRSVGADYHWRDRWDWSDAEIRAHLAQRDITLHVARRSGALVGWYELRRVPADDSVEIAYFGLMPGAIGQGLGKHLLSCAVRDAWALRANRVWLHTCTLDHPHALANYRKRGFAPYRTETYTVDSDA